MVLGKLKLMSEVKIGIIGLGYVGLPLARLFSTKYPVVGFDINESRIEELRLGEDKTREVSKELLDEVLKTENSNKNGLYFSSRLELFCNYSSHSCR